MDLLWRDETIFKNEEVFDPGYLPPAILHRDVQIRDLAASIRSALNGTPPGYILCVGPPSSGKTTVVSYVLGEFEKHGGKAVYLKCPVLRTTYNVFAKIIESVSKNLPPQKGVPLFKLVDEIAKELKDDVLVLVLDDVNFLSDNVLNDVFTILAKGTEFKLGLVAVATSKNFIARLDPYFSSVLHFHEIVFPPYSRREVEEILRWRVEHGFRQGVVSNEAFETLVELVARNGDIRYGLYLLRRAGLLAERRASRRVELRDVIAAREGEEAMMLAKSISALSSDEREALKIIYSLDKDEISAGDVYAIMKDEVGLYYERFYEIIGKLERLRFIDLVFGRKGKGRTRYIVRRYERDAILKALRE